MPLDMDGSRHTMLEVATPTMLLMRREIPGPIDDTLFDLTMRRLPRTRATCMTKPSPHISQKNARQYRRRKCKKEAKQGRCTKRQRLVSTNLPRETPTRFSDHGLVHTSPISSRHIILTARN